MAISMPLRIVLLVGIVLTMVGFFLLDGPVKLPVQILGEGIIVGSLVVAFVQYARQKRRG